MLGYSPGIPGIPDPGLLTATVNPYKTFADALGATSPLGDLIIPMLDDPTGRSIFSAGNTNTRRYEIQFPVLGGPVVIFNYAVDASWALPDPNPPGEVPDDFPMVANQPEAFRIQIVFPNNTLEYLEGGEVGGNLRIRANISDWQGMADGNIQDEVGIVAVFAPTLLVEPGGLLYVSESFDHAIYERDVSSYLLNLDSADPHLLTVVARFQSGEPKYTQGGSTIGPDASIKAFQTALVEIATVTCEDDGNNLFSEAESIDLDGDAFGTLCNPGGDMTDYRDFYVFEVPPAEVAKGSIGLLSPYESTQISLFDGSYTELGSSWVVDGYTTLEYPQELTSGTYYIRVLTENEVNMVYYDLYNYFTLDPCSDPLSFAI